MPKKTGHIDNLSKGKKAPEAMAPHPGHMKDRKTHEEYKAKAIEPKKGTHGHGHTEHKGKKSG
jgi:hypothetical protein